MLRNLSTNEIGMVCGGCNEDAEPVITVLGERMKNDTKSWVAVVVFADDTTDPIEGLPRATTGGLKKP